jgi:hypothetical protein
MDGRIIGMAVRIVDDTSDPDWWEVTLLAVRPGKNTPFFWFLAFGFVFCFWGAL